MANRLVAIDTTKPPSERLPEPVRNELDQLIDAGISGGIASAINAADIPGQVIDAVTSDDTVIQAAATAVTADIADRDLVEAHAIDDTEIGGGFADADNRATDLVYRKIDGQVPDFVIGRWGARIKAAENLVSADDVTQSLEPAEEVVAALTDADDKRTWLEARKSDGGPTDWAARLIADRVGGQLSGPLGKLAPLAAQGEARAEGLTVLANSQLTIADIAGAGTVTSIWMALDASWRDQRSYQDVRLQIFVDDETVPSVDVDLAGVFLSAYDAVEYGWNTWTEQVSSGMSTTWPNNKMTTVFQFPAPYANGCRVVLVNPCARDVAVFSQVRYQPGRTSKHRLKSICVPLANRKRMETADTHTLFQTPASSPGWLVYFGYSGQAFGTDKQSFLERDVAYYVDGESTPLIQSTGTEDIFLSGWYFSTKGLAKDNSKPWMALTHLDVSTSRPLATAVAAIDHLQAYGGTPFTAQMRADLLPESYVKQGHDYSFAALFYTTTDGAWGTPFTGTQVPSAPTHVRAFPYGSGKVLVAWSAPASQGSGPVTGYTITPSTGSPVTVDATKRTAVVSASTAITCTVTASNAAGNSAASAPSASVTPLTLTNDPTTVAGLRGWWRADERAGWEAGRGVTSLLDFSGRRGEMRMPRVLYAPQISATPLNGNPVLNFNLNDNPLMRAAVELEAAAVTIVAVLRTFTSLVASRPIIGGDSGWGLRLNASNKLVMNGGTADVGVVTVAPSTAYVVSATTGTGANVWLNNVPGTSGNAGTTVPTALWLNGDAGTYTSPRCDIAEVLVFTGQLSDTDRQTVQNYLAAKHGITLS